MPPIKPLFHAPPETVSTRHVRALPDPGRPISLLQDNTPGCTLEAKAFRDNYSQLKKLGADVIGISSDSVDSHAAFCSDLELPFTLLSDEEDKVRTTFGVPKDLFGLLPGRQTFVISKEGEVKLVYNNQFGPEKHVEEAIKALAN